MADIGRLLRSIRGNPPRVGPIVSQDPGPHRLGRRRLLRPLVHLPGADQVRIAVDICYPSPCAMERYLGRKPEPGWLVVD